MNKRILKLSVPNIVSNITLPLVGMADLAISGRLKSSAYIGAIALGSTIFNLIYWNFSFLRMSTGGFTARAYGRNDMPETFDILLRALLTAWAGALIILLFKNEIIKLALYFLKGSPEAEEYVKIYYNILIWGVPAVLSVYVFTGWFIGMQDTVRPMIIAVTTNLSNIGLSIFFVFVMNMKIEGIALGTLISHILSLIIAILLWRFSYAQKLPPLRFHKGRQIAAYKDFFKVNGDIFIRTFFLVCVTSFFTFASSAKGEEILAANALLLQLFVLFSYFIDGFAHAAEALCGRFAGANDVALMRKTIRYLLNWGMGIALFFSLLYLLGTEKFLYIFTDKPEVVSTALKYKTWTALIPLAGFAAFLWDGIYIGCNASRLMRNTMLVSSIVFFSFYTIFSPCWGNHALWFAFISYLVSRSTLQSIWARKLTRIKNKVFTH